MQFITTLTNIFTETNIYLLLHTFVEEKEKEVNIYTNSLETKDDLAKYTDVLSKYFGEKNVIFIYDPSKFVSGLQIEKDSDEKPPSKRGVLKAGSIVKTLAVEPFFISNGINDIAYGFAEWTINKERPTIFFLYGPPSTGKSHLAAKIAVGSYENGDNVYIISGYNFINELFSTFKNNTDFMEQFMDINCLVIDDIQTLNKPHLTSIMDCLFAIMNHLANTNGKLIVTCDQHPYALHNFPDRVKTRLMSDYIAEIKLPDGSIKRQHVEYNFKKMELNFDSEADEQEIKKFIVLHSPDLRVARGLLGLCDIIASQEPPISFLKFISKVPGNVTTDANSRLRGLRRLLLDFFNEEDKPRKVKSKESQRTRRTTIQTDSVCYYLLQNLIVLKTLQKELNIARNHHAYYLQKGKQIYDSIKEEALLMQIRLILQK